MNIIEICNKFAPDTSKILLEFSPGKKEELLAHFRDTHPSLTPEVINYAVDRYSELLNVRKDNKLILQGNLRDIDKIISNNSADGWNALVEIIVDNTHPAKLPPVITNIPSDPVLIINEGGVKVYRTDTFNMCQAMRSMIINIPGFKEIYDQLDDSSKNAPGSHAFGWCITHQLSFYHSYRSSKSFYFIIDSTRSPATDRWSVSVLQSNFSNPNVPFITDMNNSKEPPSNNATTWEYIVQLYPPLASSPVLLQYIKPLAVENLIDDRLKNITYLTLNRSAQIGIDAYVYRWFTADPQKAIPVERFLTLGRQYQEDYINSRAPVLFVGNPNNLAVSYPDRPLFLAPIVNALGYDVIGESIANSIARLLAAKTVWAVKLIVAKHSQNINSETIILNSEGLPILNAGKLDLIEGPVIVERLPSTKKYIYGKLKRSVGSVNRYELIIYTVGTYNSKVPIQADTLADEDRKVYDEVVKILQALQFYYLNKII